MTTPLSSPINEPSAWRRRDLRDDHYRIELSPACLDEIRRAADETRRFPLPTVLYRPEEFAMPNCAGVWPAPDAKRLSPVSVSRNACAKFRLFMTTFAVDGNRLPLLIARARFHT